MANYVTILTIKHYLMLGHYLKVIHQTLGHGVW